MITPAADDIDRLMEVMDAAFPAKFGEAWTRRQVEDAILFGRSYYYLIGEDGTQALPGQKAAGFFLSRLGVEEEELLLLAVSPQYRRRGLGRRILEELSKSAKDRGSQRIFLEMREGNNAELLYVSHGFRTIGKRPKYYLCDDGSRIDAITFALPLNESA